jgi:1-acyl-sn-glycerol-3-phosphate acyltransferase
MMWIYNPFNPPVFNLLTEERLSSPYTKFWNRISILINKVRVFGFHKTYVHFEVPFSEIQQTLNLMLVANHSHTFDIPIVTAILPAWYYFSFLAKIELFDSFFGRFLFCSSSTLAIDRAKGLEKNTLKSIKLVSNTPQWIFCMFPEGTRGDGETLLPMKPGAAHLATKNKSGFLPMGIYRKSKHIQVVVGEPIPFNAELTVEERHAVMEGAIQRCFDDAKARWGQQFQGASVEPVI